MCVIWAWERGPASGSLVSLRSLENTAQVRWEPLGRSRALLCGSEPVLCAQCPVLRTQGPVLCAQGFSSLRPRFVLSAQGLFVCAQSRVLCAPSPANSRALKKTAPRSCSRKLSRHPCTLHHIAVLFSTSRMELSGSH